MKIIIGTIIASFGIKGEVKIKSNTDFASVRYQKGNKLTIYNPINNTQLILSVSKYRNQNGFDYVLFDEITDMSKAESLKGYQILADNGALKLDDGCYYYHELFDCEIYNQNEFIGKVIDLFNGGAHLILRIQRENKKDLLYPFVDKFIDKVDIENKKIFIKPILGMLD